jgi:glucose-6-phosphate isomerase, archaeal
MKEVSANAGFPLEFDPINETISTPWDYVLKKTVRTGKELLEVVRYPEALSPSEAVYNMYEIVDMPASDKRLFVDYHLTYSLVMIPPRIIGREFIKTGGHFHSLMPGTNLGYPEIYTQIYGRLLLYLQERDPEDTSKVLDSCLVEMKPGVSVSIPPNYAHILINIDGEASLMAGLYSTDFTTDYSVVKSHRGLAYYFMEAPGGYRIERNESYKDVPGLSMLLDTNTTPFRPPHAEKPLWQAFLSDPSAYAYLSDPDALIERTKECAH